MTFVWKTTCRRLQSSGALARFAEGQVTEHESDEIRKHLAACPACQATVADALSVAGMLRTTIPASPSSSLAASGSLWATLEAEIARTPQDTAASDRHSVSDPVGSPRLQRFGRWLAAPGAMPFGTVAAAAVVGMVGIVVVYQRSGVSSLETQTASVSTVGESEITILPSPGAPPRSTAGVAVRAAAAAREPLARVAALPSPRAVDAIKVEAASAEIAPLEPKLSVRRSRLPVSPARLSLSPSTPRPAAPRAPAVQMAKAASPEFAAASASALSAPAGPAQVAEAVKPAAATGAFGGGFGGNGGSLPGHDSIMPNDADNTIVIPPASAAMAKARAVTAPVPVVPGSVASATVSGSDENISGEAQDVPAARSLLDMALRQRRQRSLFSYATR